MIKLSTFTLAGTLLFVSCSEKKEAAKAPDPRDELITALEVELRELREQSASERDEFRAQVATNLAVMAEMKELLVNLNEEREVKPESVKVEPVTEIQPPGVVTQVEAREPERSISEEDRSARILAQGEEHESVTTLGGEVFHEVVITEISDIGVAIRHRTGAGRIPFEDLPAEWQERFGYDPILAARALKQENIAQMKYARKASEMIIARKEKDEKLDQQLREALLALAIADANRPRSSSVTIIDDTPQIIPVQRNVIDDPYCDVPVIYPTIVRNNDHQNHRPASINPPRQPVVLTPHPAKPVVTPTPTPRPMVPRPSTPRPVVERPSTPRPSVSRPSVPRESPRSSQTPSAPVIRSIPRSR